MLSDEKMAEAEVSVRLALYLIRQRLVTADVAVAIDGAQVQTSGAVHFAMAAFLQASGCSALGAHAWQGHHVVTDGDYRIRIHSSSGSGDVVAPLITGEVLRVESKKGPLKRSKSSAEYPLMREAIGQLMTVDQAAANDLLAIAVPHSAKFAELAERWRDAPLIRRLGLQLLTVHRDGDVSGLVLAAA